MYNKVFGLKYALHSRSVQFTVPVPGELLYKFVLIKNLSYVLN